MTLIRAILSFDAFNNNWIVSAKDSDYFGISGSAETLEQAVGNFAATLEAVLLTKQFQILIGGR